MDASKRSLSLSSGRAVKAYTPEEKAAMKKAKCKTGAFNKTPFNGATDYEKNLENAGKASKKWITKPRIGQKHRITDGRYKGELCKVELYVNDSTFCQVVLCDAFGADTKNRDLVPVKFLSWLSGVGSKSD